MHNRDAEITHFNFAQGVNNFPPFYILLSCVGRALAVSWSPYKGPTKSEGCNQGKHCERYFFLPLLQLIIKQVRVKSAPGKINIQNNWMTNHERPSEYPVSSLRLEPVKYRMQRRNISYSSTDFKYEIPNIQQTLFTYCNHSGRNRMWSHVH
jgi:hypothetical protein